jgi:hypothetical protein
LASQEKKQRILNLKTNKMAAITQERWNEAQIAERKAHIHSFEDGRAWYGKIYQRYFDYIGLSLDVQGKSILEIGCADFPALGYCHNIGKSYIIEPMPSDYLNRMIEGKDITLFKEPCEELTLPKVDEVWLLNVLQHVIDPDVIINQCKDAAKVIRFFEPINYPIEPCHPHQFTLDYFRGHFGDCVKHYPMNPTEPEFHTWENAYGVYEKI